MIGSHHPKLRSRFPISLCQIGVVIALAWSWSSAAQAQGPGADNVVVPFHDATLEGSTNTSYPFGEGSMRYQQVYSAAQFRAWGRISELAFRPDGPLGTGATTVNPLFPTGVSVRVVLSTTRARPEELSRRFEDNLGWDRTVVYDSNVHGPWEVSTSFAGPGGNGPTDYNAFDIRMRLPVPFFYDPREGNLLLDVTMTSTAPGLPAFDAEGARGEAVSRIYANNATASVATGADSSGLVTQFTFGSFAVIRPEECGADNGQLAWLVFSAKLAEIQQLDAPLANAAFNNPCTLIAGAPTASPVPQGWHSVPLASLDSFANFRTDLLTPGAIADGLQVVLYDNETWGGLNLTPRQEKLNPAIYERLFANLAHAYGYAFLSAPGTDLVTVQPGYVPGQRNYPQYIQMGFPQFSAQAPAEFYDMQAQGAQSTEPSPDCSSIYCSFVKTASQVAHRANPETLLLAGVSTDPVNISATVTQMFGAVQDTKDFVTGYWLNVPNNDAVLATCFLRAVRRAGWIHGDGWDNASGSDLDCKSVQ